jgi:phosphate-selective porin OprO and OprP
MSLRLRRYLGGALVCGTALLSLGPPARAQDGARPLPTAGAVQSDHEELVGRVEQLERKNQELMRAVQHTSLDVGTAASAPPARQEVQKIVADYLQERDNQKQSEETARNAVADAEGYRVGSLLNMQAAFQKDGQLLLYTPNKDFTMHVGFLLQYDNVFWDQSALLRTAPGARPGAKQDVASGAALGGVGDLEDGTYFRRIRPALEGTLWDTYEYRLELAMENIQYSTVGHAELWLGANDVPGVGTVRIGHVRNAIGFESDMSGPSRAGTFMERSAYAEAIELNQNFVSGIWQTNNYLDQHATSTATIFRTDNGVSSGAYFGDGQWGAQGRLTALPLYDCDGRTWLHLGLSGGWRNGSSNDSTSGYRTFELRARPELRDDDPAGSPSGGQAVPNADSNRLIDTGVIVASDEWISGLELCYVRGPFSIQAEYGWTWIDDAVGFAPTGFTLNPKLKTPQDYVFSGGYVQLAYTLTGEARGYDRRYGTLTRGYFNQEGPFTNAFLNRGEDGRYNWGWGAWELAARYTYVNLNDGTGLNRIQGGVYDGLTVGLNWFLNDNIKFNFDWVYSQRSSVPIGTIPGYTQGLGARVQLAF